ncbi:MAG: RagB/SusD family nutrient uptake outer membrane protein, partial [Chitinophagaceae bacterium]|nr:RagB/SusD family nutrient uptake outer membrane protein [Chitinophagaceae bacterium]
ARPIALARRTSGIERTILNERKIELMGEGKRWYDLCRIGKIYDYTDAGYEYLRETMNAVLTERKSRSSLYAGALLFEGVNMGRILFPINSIAFNNNQRLLGDQNPPYDE